MQTALGCSGSAFTSILLLISGLIYASIQMQDSGEKVGILVVLYTLKHDFVAPHEISMLV
jgi:hypothetical protein